MPLGFFVAFAAVVVVSRVTEDDDNVGSQKMLTIAGFDNISADIMLGIPHQTKESLSSTLETAGDLPLSHISAYMLKIEEETPFNSDEIIKPSPMTTQRQNFIFIQ